MARIAGLLVIAIAIVSAAAISVGSAGYIGVFLALPEPVLVAGVVLAMGAIGAWGVKESVTFAGAMTLIEVGGLVLLVLAGMASGPELVTRLPEAVPPLGDGKVFAGIMGTALLAVFAFIGFEGLANIAEEVRDPQRTLPRAIFLTLAVSTVLYVLVAWVALVAVPHEELAQSRAPLGLVFERLTGASPRIMSLIAIVATLNGIIVQIIMSSRVLYGLAQQGNLPAAFGTVHSVTRTPLFATVFTTALVLLFALLLPLHHLADLTSRITLVVFALVNLSLIRIKARTPVAPAGAYVAPNWAPWAGFVSCLGLLIADVGLMLAAIGSGEPDADPARRSVELAHGDDAERAQHAVLLLDRHVFPRHEGVAVEAEAGLVMAGVAVDVVVEGPHVAALVYDVPDFLALVRPEAAYATALAQLFPRIEVDVALGVEGRNEIVAALSAALGKIMVARQFETHTTQQLLSLGHHSLLRTTVLAHLGKAARGTLIRVKVPRDLCSPLCVE